MTLAPEQPLLSHDRARDFLTLWTLALLCGLSVAGALLPIPPLLQFAFPALAAAASLLLLWRRPAAWLGFAWTVWMIAPWVRRLVDHQAGWNPTSPVALVPYVVTLACVVPIARRFPAAPAALRAPFLLLAAALLAGYGIGVVRNGLLAATFDLATWSMPLLLGLHLAVAPTMLARHLRVTRTAFLWGALLLGAYGIVQVLTLPPWDATWLRHAPITSVGSARIGDFRVFGTLNSQGPFANYMMAGMLLLLHHRHPLRWVAFLLGAAGWLLSLVRSAWGAFFVGVAVLPFVARGRRRFVPLGSTVVLALVFAGLALVVPLPERLAANLSERFASFGELESDVSFRARLAFAGFAAEAVAQEPLGSGLGRTGLAARLGELERVLVFDNGFLNVPFVLGIGGALLYFGALAFLLVRALTLRGEGARRLPAARSICVAWLSLMLFENSLVGASGVVFWAFLGLLLAARDAPSGETEAAVRQRLPRESGSQIRCPSTECLDSYSLRSVVLALRDKDSGKRFRRAPAATSAATAPPSRSPASPAPRGRRGPPRAP